MLSMEQSVKAQFEKLFDVTDWWLFKTMAELNLKQAAELKKKDMPVPEPYQLVARNSGKRLLIGVGVELLLKSVCLKHGYLINEPKIPGALASPYFDDLRMRNRTSSRSNIFLITHDPHPVRLLPEKRHPGYEPAENSARKCRQTWGLYTVVPMTP